MISTATGGTSMEESATSSDTEIEKIADTSAGKIKKIEDILSFKIGQSLYPLVKPFNEYPRKGIRSSKL